MPLPLLLAGVLGLQIRVPESPRATVRHAAAAVEGDSVPAVRRRWLEAAGGGDRSALLGLGTLAHLTYDLDAADSLLTLLLSAPGAPPDAVSLRARLGLAQVARSRGALPQAEGLLETALQEARRIGDEKTGTETLLLLALTRARTVGPAAAKVLFAEAAPLVGGDPFLGALYYCGQAEVAVLSSRPAADDADKGARLAEEAGEPRLRSSCLGSRASDRARTGDISGAVADMGAAADLRRRLRDYAGLAVALQWRGFMLRSVGSLEEARKDLEEALDAARISHADSPRAWAYANLAFIDLAVGDTRTGAAHADSAAALFAAQGDRYGQGALAGAMGDIALAGGDPHAAHAAYARSVETLEPLGFAVGVVTARIGLAHAAMADGSWDEAERQLDSARVAAENAGMEGRLQGLAYHRGVLALKRGRLDEAEAVLSSALRRVETAWRMDPAGGQPDWAYYYRLRLAEIAARKGDTDAAATLAAEAMDGIEAWRATLSQPELRLLAFQVSEDRSDPDLGFASIVAALVRGGRLDDAFALAERMRARSLQDQLARIEAPGDSTAGAPAGAAATALHAATVPEVVSAVPDDRTALLAWVTGRGGEPTTLIVAGRFGVRAAVLEPVDSMAPAIRRLDAVIGSGGWSDPLSRAVAEAVFGDALSLLPPSVSHLVLVPDGSLHLVPFDALVLPDGSALMERFTLAVQPSASLATMAWRSGPTPLPGAVLAVGDPHPAGGAQAGLQPLPRAAGEVREAARYGIGSVALTGEEATEARFKRVAPGPWGMLHFATHTRLDEASLAGAELLLAPGDGEDGVIRAGELARMRLQAGIALLSACSTASGTVVRGEGVVGLASALRVAGVRSVILTRWPLDDRAAAGLVETVYRGLSEGMTVADAVRAAKLAARERGAPAEVWATLTVVGDERLTLPLRPPSPRRRLMAFVALAAVALVLGLGVRAMRARRWRADAVSRGRA